MWFARAGFPPGTRAKKTRFWRPTTRSGWAPFFMALLKLLDHPTAVDGISPCAEAPCAPKNLAPMRFRLATWNINSVRLRLDLVERFVRAQRPDVLCLQEIKCEDGTFPALALRALGFPHIAVSGQKGYHGVATLSRLPFSSVERRDICGRGHARHLSVALDGANAAKPLVLHNVYVPAGGDLPDPALNPKFRHKLDFLEALECLVGGHARQAQEPHDHGRRSQRRAAPDRCLVAQAAPESGEPYAGGGRAARARAGLASIGST